MPIYLEYMGYSVEVPAGATMVGRDVTCALRFNDEGISRRHMCLVRSGDEVFVEDLGSTNGTTLNGKPLAGTARLRDRDVVELGSYRLVLRIVGDDEDQSSTRRESSLAELGAIKKPRASTPRPSAPTRASRPTLRPAERREHERRKLALDVTYASDQLELEVTTHDLSLSGVFVTSDVLEPIGTTCQLTILVDGAPAVSVRGVVRRVVERTGDDGESGFAVEFVDLGDAERKWLETALATPVVTMPFPRVD